MKTVRTFVSLVSALAVVALGVSGVAYGEDTESRQPASDINQHIYAVAEAIKFDEASITVSYADLNLNNEKGATVLYRRLQNAAESVCGVGLARDQRCLRSQQLADDCYHKALSTAVESVGSDVLMGLHQGTKPAEMYAAKVK